MIARSLDDSFRGLSFPFCKTRDLKIEDWRDQVNLPRPFPKKLEDFHRNCGNLYPDFIGWATLWSLESDSQLGNEDLENLEPGQVIL
jgi:hypothetical protein